MSASRGEPHRLELAGENLRLRLRIDELGTALRQKQEQFLQMLGRLQEREEEAVQRAIEELSRSEERFRLLIESVEDYAIFFLDRGGRITSWNPGAARLLGYDEADVLAQPFTIFREPHATGDIDQQLAKAAAEKKLESEGWRKRKDGSLAWMNEIITALRGARGEPLGFVDIMRDLTARNHYQTVLEDTANELEQTIESLEARTEEAEQARAAAEAAQSRAALLAEVGRAAGASFDPAGMLHSVANLLVPEFADGCIIFLVADDGALSPAAALHASDEETEDLAAVMTKLLQGRRRGGSIYEVLRHVRGELYQGPNLHNLLPAGTTADVLPARIRSVVLVPMAAREDALGVICCFREGDRAAFDPADLVFLEAIGRRVGVAVDNAQLYESAVLANRAKSEFLAVMSHELRTPLNAVIGYTDILDAGIEGAVNEKQRQHLERIKHSAHHLLGIIQEILGYARMESGREEIRLDVVNAVEIARAAAAIAQPLVAEKHLQLHVLLPPSDVMITSDPGKLRQILINLLSNAVKFTEAGEIRLSLEEGDAHVTFRVSDTGVGIPAEYQQKIFDPFWQMAQGTTRNVGGTGLGLSVSRKLTELLGGELHVQSEPGKGSTFTVVLPWEIAVAAD